MSNVLFRYAGVAHFVPYDGVKCAELIERENIMISVVVSKLTEHST